MQTSLFCGLVKLLDEGTAVAAPQDVVYSTQPRKAIGLDGHNYYVKGPDLHVTVAECVAHQLAEMLEIEVPDFGIAILEGTDGPLFASKEVARCHRQVDTWIQRNRTTNPEMLPLMTAFDVWVANKDRNIGNIVGQEQGGRVKLVAIDFEKSMALRGPYPLTTVPQISPAALWPSGTLGQLLKGQSMPHDFCERIGRVGEGAVLEAFGAVEGRINAAIPWKENSVQLLLARAGAMKKLVREVWR